MQNVNVRKIKSRLNVVNVHSVWYNQKREWQIAQHKLITPTQGHPDNL